MVKQRKIVGIWPEQSSESADAQDAPLELTAASMLPEPDNGAEARMSDPKPVVDPRDWVRGGEMAEDAPVAGTRGRAVPWLAGLLSMLGLAWLFAVAWVMSGRGAALPDAATAVQWTAVAAMPLALLLLVWLAIERGSSRSVARHLQLLGALREEQDRLGARLQAVDAQWRSAQQLLDVRAASTGAAVSANAEAIEAAAMRLDGGLRETVGTAAQLLAQVEQATRQFDGLTVALPKSEDVARRIAETLQGAAHSAYQQGGRLEEQLAAVRQELGDVERRADEALATVAARLVEVTGSGSAAEESSRKAVAELSKAIDDQRVAALAMLADLAASIETSTASVEARLTDARTLIDQAGLAQLGALEQRMAGASTQAAALESVIERATHGSESLGAALGEQLGSVETRLATFASDAEARLAAVSGSIQQTTRSLDGLTAAGERNGETLAAIRERIDAARSQFEAMEAQFQAALPQALADLDERVAAVRSRVEALPALVEQGAAGATTLLAQIGEAEQLLDQQARQLAALSAAGEGQLQAQGSRIAELGAAMNAVAASIVAIKESALPALAAAVDTQAAAAGQTVAAVEARIADAAASVGQQSERIIAAAIDKALGDATAERLAALTESASQATAAAESASDRIARQLAAIGDSSSAVEARAAAFAETINRRNGESLARQMTLASEALHSLSVDLARVLDSEIADHAWQAWFKGDRSVFARRTVRLLTNAEAREVHRRYDSDEAFRGLVNRYIHDFEAMLRRLVDAPEGDALTVTLLSSDIGKIYVALAQAIERLRN